MKNQHRERVVPGTKAVFFSGLLMLAIAISAEAGPKPKKKAVAPAAKSSTTATKSNNVQSRAISARKAPVVYSSIEEAEAARKASLEAEKNAE